MGEPGSQTVIRKSVSECEARAKTDAASASQPWPSTPRILDLWCGKKTATIPFEQAGAEIISVDINPDFNPTICKDILEVTVAELEALGPFDFIWASPECTCFSFAAQRAHHMIPGPTAWAEPTPRTKRAKGMVERIKWTLHLIEELDPTFWVMENPRAYLRQFKFMRPYMNATVTLCTYGDKRRKLTDLWGEFPLTWRPKRPCTSGKCKKHIPAPRDGERPDTDWGNKDPADNATIPFELGESLRIACEESQGQAWATLRRWIN